MLEKAKFINHLNEEIQFGENGIYINYSDLHDYLWNVDSRNNKISGFKKGIVQKTIPLIIDSNQGLHIKNRLMEVAEKDILSGKNGRLFIGEYYLNCFIIGSQKHDYLIDKNHIKIDLQVVSDHCMWIKESTISYRTNGDVVGLEESQDKGFFDFNIDYPFDWMNSMNSKELINNAFIGSNFKMIIYGQATNPKINISGHTYEVKCEINSGEYLEIDSIQKTIHLVKNDGTIVNKFNDRNKDSYIFEPIPSGHNSVIMNGKFGLDVIVYEERSEPRWT